MVRDLLLDIVNKWRISDIILLLISILAFVLTWLTALSLGLKILKIEIKIKYIIPGIFLGSLISIFVKPFIPGALAFFCTLIPLFACLKYYSKAKWIITSWVTFLVLLSTAVFPIIISPLLSTNHTLSLFFSQNKYSIPLASLLELVGMGLVFTFITIFDISLIPNPTLTSINFYDIYLYFALCFLCFYSSVEIWKNLMRFSMWRLIVWTVSITAFIAFSLRKAHEKRKNLEYQKKIEIAENKIQELTELAIKNQQNNKTKPNTPRPDLENREKKIIKSIIEGKSNNEIASEVYVSDGRIGNLITPIYRKLGVKNRVQLITYIVKNNLLDWICED